MNIPEDHYLLYQPKYRTPCVFDLHPRGMFTSRPPLLQSYGYRLLVDAGHLVQLQVAWLAARDVPDPQTNQRYSWVLEKALVALNADLALDPVALAEAVGDEAVCQNVIRDHGQWRESYVPGPADDSVDHDALDRKLGAAIRDARETARQILLEKNRPWIDAALPRLIFDFRHGLYTLVDDRLYPDYRDRGGKENEVELFRKIMGFYRICEHEGSDRLTRPDGKRWNGEDEIEACWIGFAGSEEEARRVVETMQAVIRPLAGAASG